MFVQNSKLLGDLYVNVCIEISSEYYRNFFNRLTVQWQEEYY